MIRTSIVLLAAAASCAAVLLSSTPPASAQSAAPLAGVDRSPDWTLDTGSAAPKAARKKAKGKAPAKPALSPEEAGSAARLTEARRKFFEKKPDDTADDKVPDFGGYDAGTMGDGSLKPGFGMKF